MTTNLKDMSKKQLEKLRKDIDKALASLSNKEKREAKKAAEKAAAKFGFSLSELTGTAATAKVKAAKPAKRGPKKASPPKYANPDDASQTWTGKGRQPQWFKAAVEAGTDIASMEI